MLLPCSTQKLSRIHPLSGCIVEGPRNIGAVTAFGGGATHGQFQTGRVVPGFRDVGQVLATLGRPGRNGRRAAIDGRATVAVPVNQ